MWKSVPLKPSPSTGPSPTSQRPCLKTPRPGGHTHLQEDACSSAHPEGRAHHRRLQQRPHQNQPHHNHTVGMLVVTCLLQRHGRLHMPVPSCISCQKPNLTIDHPLSRCPNPGRWSISTYLGQCQVLWKLCFLVPEHGTCASMQSCP